MKCPRCGYDNPFFSEKGKIGGKVSGGLKAEKARLARKKYMEKRKKEKEV